MIYTPGIMGLKEPEYGDDADIGDINDNSVVIDDHMTNAFNNIAEPFDTAKAYEVGEIVVYEKVTYIFTAAKNAGAWDATKVEVKPLGTAIFEKEGGGASSLSDLTDTDIDTPVEGEVLTWDGEKWVNAEGTPAVTKAASGNPIELTDAASAPLVKCVTQITGSQDLHGYDKPWVGGAGKNKLNAPDKTLSGSGYMIATNTPLVLSSGTYTFSFDASATDGTGRYNIIIKDLDNNNLANETRTLVLGNNSVTLTITADSATIIVYSSNTVSCNYTNFMVESGSTPTAYAPYSNICPITAYTEGEIEVRGRNILNPDIIQSGYSLGTTTGLPIVDASRTATTSPIDVSGNTTVYLNYTSSVAQTRVIYSKFKNGTFVSRTSGFVVGSIDASDADELYLCWYSNNGTVSKSDLSNVQLENGSTGTSYVPYVTPTTHTTAYPSAIYRGSEDCVNGEVTSEWGYIASYNGETLPGEWISDRDEYAPGTTPTTGAQVAYALATPTTSSVTPTNLPIRTLSGYNHIESSTGEMVIDYITEGYQPLVDLTQSSQHVYATTEQVVGKWVDGSDLYERVITFTLPSSGTYTSMPIDLTGVDKVWVVVSDSFAINTYSGTKYSSPFGHYISNPTETDVGGFLVINGASSTYEYKVGSFFYEGEGVLTLRYTKSTTTTRSLSKGSTDSLRAEISGEKKEIEESVDKVDKVDEPTETIEEADETEGNADEMQDETVTE